VKGLPTQPGEEDHSEAILAALGLG
jgi:hypothetical protein